MLTSRAVPELRTCGAVDCDREFPVTRRDRVYCSSVCRVRMVRWRKFGEPQQRPLYSTALAGADLDEVRRAAIHELVHGALCGADQATMAKVAGLVVACDRRLTRESVGADAGSR